MQSVFSILGLGNFRMAEFIVRVGDEPCLVTTNKRSKTAWVASGEYMGKRHSSEHRTEGAAVKQWRESAQRDQGIQSF